MADQGNLIRHLFARGHNGHSPTCGLAEGLCTYVPRKVCLLVWHETDIPRCPPNDRCRGQRGHSTGSAKGPRLTELGHCADWQRWTVNPSTRAKRVYFFAGIRRLARSVPTI